MQFVEFYRDNEQLSIDVKNFYFNNEIIDNSFHHEFKRLLMNSLSEMK